MIFLTIMSYSLLAIYESIPLYKQQQWRDLWVNSFLAVCSFTTALLLSFGIKILSPAEPIKDIVLSVFGK